MPKAMAAAMFDLGTACITSALCLTHLALVHIAQVIAIFNHYVLLLLFVVHLKRGTPL